MSDAIRIGMITAAFFAVVVLPTELWGWAGLAGAAPTLLGAIWLYSRSPRARRWRNAFLYGWIMAVVVGVSTATDGFGLTGVPRFLAVAVVAGTVGGVLSVALQRLVGYGFPMDIPEKDRGR